jgi:hypothetical protein
MEHKIINTGDYLIVVDDSEIKKETYCYDSINNILVFYKGSMKNIGFQKVISHLPIKNSPILEGVDILPPLEDEVEKLAKNFAKESGERYIYEDFKAGYNKAKEKYKYTEEDILAAIEIGFDLGKNFDDDNPNIGLGWLIYQKDNFIQSIQQPKIVGFKCEMVNFEVDMGLNEECIEYSQHPKTIINSQGNTQWLGEYIYD